MEAWWYRLPLAARIMMNSLTAGSTALGTVLLFSRYRTFADALVAELKVAAVIGLVVGTVGTLLCERRLPREFGSMEQFIGYSSALRTGELPAGIEPQLWRVWLHRSRKSNRWTLVTAFLLAIVVVGGMLTDRPAYDWVIASLFAMVAIWALVAWWSKRGRISRLATAIEQRAAATATN